MEMQERLEITITHNLDDPEEVKQLLKNQWIALDWGRKGSDPELYSGRARTDVKLFNELQQHGGAVIAAFNGAVQKRSYRLIGFVEREAKFQQLNGLLCLPLAKARIVDSSRSFLGNLPPRSCTVQRCSNRAKGRLDDFVRGKTSLRSVWSLHNRDVEWLVTNYLISSNLCSSVWSGIQTFQDIDHAGWMKCGYELLAQTTVSEQFPAEKAGKLLELAAANRELHFFGPQVASEQCPVGITYHAIEDVFDQMNKLPNGKWLIDRMLATSDKPA